MRRAALLLLVACGGVPQAPECERFLRCSEALEPMSTTSTFPTYGPGGTCWQNASDAAACTEVCRLAVMAMPECS